MFKITANPEFTHDVPVSVPVDEAPGAGGRGNAAAILRTTFRALPTSEAGLHDLSTYEGVRAFLDQVVVMFHDLVDDNDQVVPYTATVRASLMDRAWIRAALVQHYFAAVSGARAGN